MAARRGGWGTWLPVVAGVAATVLTLYFFTTPADQGDEPYSPPTTTASVPGGSASSAGTGATDPVSGLAWVDLAALPPGAADTVDLIDAGGPFPYDEDDGTFGNFEGVLPDQPRGYYREYTVETPGSNDRGARRIVAGSEGELYWTADHYQSFERIRR